MEHGLYLLREGEEALTALVSVPGEFGGAPPINIEVTAPKPGTAARFLAEIRENMRRHNVYRGQVLALGNPHGLSARVVRGSSFWRPR